MTPRSCTRMLLVLGLLAAIGCSKEPTTEDDDSAHGGDDDDSTDGPIGDPATVPLEGACALDQRLGGFVVEAYEDYSIVDGTVSDGVVPLSVLGEVTQEGSCRLMRRNNPFCDPPCAPDEACDFDGECIPYPQPQDLGTVTVLGLEAEVVMEPVVPGYSYFDTSLPHPVFEPWELLELRTTGGAVDAFTLHGLGVHPMDGADLEWVVVEDAPLQVTWTAPDVEVRSTVALTLNIDQHGASPITVHCAFEDVGTGEVPASLIAQLFGAGVSGYPNGSIRRHTVDSTSVGVGCVDLEINSPRAANVDVAGYIPCTDDDDCPDGLECNEVIGLCE